MFLSEIKTRFVQTYGLARIRDALPYSMNSDFSGLLASEMKRYSESRSLDAVSRVQGQLDEVKDIMVKNIDNIAARGERLELLVNKAEGLNNASVAFQKRSRSVANQMYWKNIKFSMMVGGICLLVIYIIVSFSCGGPLWGNCIGGSSNSSHSP
jgi:vesicle-associated membrane protein 7